MMPRYNISNSLVSLPISLCLASSKQLPSLLFFSVLKEVEFWCYVINHSIEHSTNIIILCCCSSLPLFFLDYYFHKENYVAMNLFLRRPF